MTADSVDINKLRELAKAQMPNDSRGKWYARETYVYQSSDPRDRRQVCRVPTVARPNEVDPTAAFIAAACPAAILVLCDELDQLRERLAIADKAIDETRELALGVADEIIIERDQAGQDVDRYRRGYEQARDISQSAHAMINDELLPALAAMTKARDEACEIAEAATFVIDNGLCEKCSASVENIEVERIDAIRRVGADNRFGRAKEK